MGDQPKASKSDTLKRLRQVVTLGALALALAHLLWPSLAIDYITLVLIVIALVPWLAPIFKSLEFPGGWKLEFQELQRAAERADAAGLLAPQAPVTEYSLERVAQHDPNLALAGLRIEIEKRLVTLAEKKGLQVRGRGLSQLLRALNQHQVLDDAAQSALADMTGLLNSAVHGAAVDPNSAMWAMNIGPRILTGLDELIAKS